MIIELTGPASTLIVLLDRLAGAIIVELVLCILVNDGATVFWYNLRINV